MKYRLTATSSDLVDDPYPYTESQYNIIEEVSLSEMCEKSIEVKALRTITIPSTTI